MKKATTQQAALEAASTSGKYIIVGIDPGVLTGIAIYEAKSKEYILITSGSILAVMGLLQALQNLKPCIMCIYLEDARLRRWFGKTGPEVLQGAGSIKRDCQIWEEYLRLHKIPYELIAPKNSLTKLPAATFEKMTGYTGRTNEHERDAAALVYGRRY